jgi:hypothetical protein
MIVRPSIPSWAAKVGLLGLLAVSGWQCLDTPNYPVEPQIEFVALSRDTMDQGVFEEDSIFVVFSFQDGDGDIGRDAQSGGNNVFFIDRRTNTLDNTYGIPEIPEEGAANGVEGEVRILLYSTCCIYPDGADPCTVNPAFPLDTVSYDIYMTDRAGHRSNTIATPPIILRCR